MVYLRAGAARSCFAHDRVDENQLVAGDLLPFLAKFSRRDQNPAEFRPVLLDIERDLFVGNFPGERLQHMPGQKIGDTSQRRRPQTDANEGSRLVKPIEKEQRGENADAFRDDNGEPRQHRGPLPCPAHHAETSGQLLIIADGIGSVFHVNASVSCYRESVRKNLKARRPTSDTTTTRHRAFPRRLGLRRCRQCCPASRPGSARSPRQSRLR